MRVAVSLCSRWLCVLGELPAIVAGDPSATTWIGICQVVIERTVQAGAFLMQWPTAATLAPTTAPARITATRN